MSFSKRSFIIHQLPEYEIAGYPPSLEYPLPADFGESEHESLHPWLWHLSSLTPPQAKECLVERWKDIRYEPICCLRDHILEFDTKSIIITGERAWVLCVHSNGAFYLIAQPSDEKRIIEKQVEHGLEHNTMLLELLAHFGGLREDFVPSGGCLIDGNEWIIINEPFMEDIKGYDNWKNSLVIFHARNGDLLLQHSSGKVGWWVGDEMRMRDAYDDLGTCLMDFIRCQMVPWPFDSYGPRNDYWQ